MTSRISRRRFGVLAGATTASAFLPGRAFAQAKTLTALGHRVHQTAATTGPGGDATEGFRKASDAAVNWVTFGDVNAVHERLLREASLSETSIDVAYLVNGRAVPRNLQLFEPLDALMKQAPIEAFDDVAPGLSDDALITQSAVNLHATVRLLQEFLPGMLKRGFGRVIAIGSVQEARPNPSHFYYAATKAAQTNMVLNLARTTRASGVTFNIVRPGAILTDRNRASLAQPGREEEVLDRIPLGRIGRPDDCAGVVLLLCSDAGSYINGAEIAVDGGLRL